MRRRGSCPRSVPSLRCFFFVLLNACSRLPGNLPVYSPPSIPASSKQSNNPSHPRIGIPSLTSPSTDNHSPPPHLENPTYLPPPPTDLPVRSKLIKHPARRAAPVLADIARHPPLQRTGSLRRRPAQGTEPCPRERVYAGPGDYAA